MASASCQFPGRKGQLGRSVSCPGPAPPFHPSSAHSVPSHLPSQRSGQPNVCEGCRALSQKEIPDLHFQWPSEAPPSRNGVTCAADHEGPKSKRHGRLRSMASKLCCTADEDGRATSPPLPNARMSDATPARRPLLHQGAGSQGSHFTSARSEDLHELREIFHNAQDPQDPNSSHEKPNRARFLRPSVYSLHSLHRIKSVPGLGKKKRSRDMKKTPANVLTKRQRPRKDSPDVEPETVIRATQDVPNLQLNITKSDLRKDLLSDKVPEEGGYDPDAEVLDDIARRVSKKSPSKRPSLHSIDWTSSR